MSLQVETAAQRQRFALGFEQLLQRQTAEGFVEAQANRLLAQIGFAGGFKAPVEQFAAQLFKGQAPLFGVQL